MSERDERTSDARRAREAAPSDAARPSLEQQMEWETEVEPAAARTTRPLEITTTNADDPPSTGDVVGETVGGLSGVVTGAAIGSAGGPLGTLIGAIAGALGGWWAGRAIAEAAATVSDEDDAWFREHFDDGEALADGWTWERARPAYRLGWLAARDPEWTEREWEAVEPELRRGWSEDAARAHGGWEEASRFVAAGYARGRGMRGRTER